MRRLMWFALGFGAACLLCAYLWLTGGVFMSALFVMAAGIGLLLASKRVSWLGCAGVSFLGIALGLCWFQFYCGNYLSITTELDGRIADTTARCTDFSYETDYGTAVEGVLYLEGKPYRGKFYVNGKYDMEPGDVLEGKFRFRITTPDGAKDATSHPGKGIFLLAYQQEDVTLTKFVEDPSWSVPARLRRSVLSLIDRLFPTDAAPFARALLLGDRTGIDYETNTAFKISGISHVIAVSGLHITILFTLINIFCFKRRFLVAFLGIPSLALFAALVGFSPSVTRACIMHSLMILAMLFDREYDGPTELAFACLVMMAFNPLVVTSVSFQLSVGCMIGIFLFRKKIYDWFCDKLSCKGKGIKAGFQRTVAGSVSVTLSAMTVTTPLVAYYFGCVSLVGVLTNLLTLWVITYIFYGILIACLLGFLWPAVGSVVGSIVAWPIRYVLITAKALASFPLAAVYTRSVYIVAWLVFCYLLLAVFLLSRKKRPGLLLCCCAIGLCLSLAGSWLEPMTDSCRMTVLNTGQGQCILLQSEGKTYMIDCGGSDDEETADLAAETLLSQGIMRLDGIVLTHLDRDHSGGLAYLLSRIPADILFVPGYSDDSGVLCGIHQLCPNVVGIREDICLSYGNTEVTIYAPVVPGTGNESSLAVLFRKGNCDILITGDRNGFGERMLLRTARIPEVEILVAGHHGSKHSTGEELLDAVKPDIVTISVGENYYGHPAPELLARLEAYGCLVYRTDLHGNLIFRR